MTDRRILLLRTGLLWILLELLAAAQVRSPSGALVLWEWLRAVVTPVLWAGESVGSAMSHVLTAVTEASGLVIENRRLRLELESSRAMRWITEEDMAARRELGSLVSLVPDLASTAIPARTTYRDLARGRLIAVVSVDRRVMPDTPAVAGGGVIGRVIRSEGQRCWIELITHPVAAVAVQTRDGEVQGLAVGNEAGALDVQFVPRQAEVLRGDELVTSGADGIYPPGLPVGRVSVVREGAGAFLEVRAEPAAALATCRVVLLLDGWTGDPTTRGSRR